jgi:hypothetical protein
MSVGQSFFQEAANNTAGFSEASRQLTAWTSAQFRVATPTVTSSAASRLLDQIFERTRVIPVFKCDYYSFADMLEDSVLRELPSATGLFNLTDVVRPEARPRDVEHGDDPANLVRDIVDWLDITYADLSKITGIGRSTLFHWRSHSGSLRATSSRSLYRVHALASLLVKRFGAAGAKSWLQTGPDRPWDHLIVGDVDSVERIMRSALFHQQNKNFAPQPAVGGEDNLPPIVEHDASTLTRAKRRPRRGRLQSDH